MLKNNIASYKQYRVFLSLVDKNQIQKTSKISKPTLTLVSLLTIITIAFCIIIAYFISFPLSDNKVYAQSAYDSGFDHGCSDAKISNPNNRYINQPDKGSGFHSELFMKGYKDGFDSCANIQNNKSNINPSNEELASSSSKPGIFKIIVKVTNNQDSDEKGGIYVTIDNSRGISKTLHNIIFPAKSTVTKTFEFNSKDVPVGKGFSAEVIYGDDYDEEAHGINSPSTNPEVLQIYLGSPNPISDSKFKLNVKVTNNGIAEQTGYVQTIIDGTNIYKSLDGPFPAKSTVTKTFEFNSKDVPVGKGFAVTLIAREGALQTEQTKHGINTRSTSAETINFILGSESKFLVNVQITNNAINNNYGFISIKTDEPNSISKYLSVDLPAKSTVTKTFEFNSKDVPVGKGFNVHLSYGTNGQIEKSGTNSPSTKPEIIPFSIS